MEQYLPWDSVLLLGESMDLPLLAMPLTPRPIVEEMVLGSAVGSPAVEPVATPLRSMPDLSREFIRMLRSRGPLHVCWTVYRAVNIG